MSERDRRLAARFESVAATGRANEAYLVESLAYGNLKLEDQRLERSTIIEATRRLAKSSR